MRYRKLRADKIFDGFDWLSDDSVLIVEQNGTIHNIVSQSEAGEEIEQLKGILVPGLINCHCHLELSHLKDAVPPGTGLINFLLSVIKKRDSAEKHIDHIITAEKEMVTNGIVAVADICNTADAISIKKESSIHWHNLVEFINLHDRNIQQRLAHFNLVLDQYKKSGSEKTHTTLTPHAPYSVSAGSFKALNEVSAKAVISIHNQETGAENELFKNGQGEFLKLYEALGEARSPLEVSGATSLQTWLPYFTNGQTILLVHNTFISEEDIVFAKSHSEKYGLRLVYCLCPNANLYIENALPPIDLLIKHKCKMVLGTDSYSSNWQLNIAAEIKTLCTHFPHIPLETILQWATSNGAQALNYSSFLGKLEKGKRPGIVLLETDPLSKETLTGKSKRMI
jgi:cytosine/adenosine deaminase-related metal-dependent hydrolase